MITALLFPLRLLIAPIDYLLAAHFREVTSRVLFAQALADAAECPDEIEPPAEPTPIHDQLAAEHAEMGDDTIAARIREWSS